MLLSGLLPNSQQFLGTLHGWLPGHCNTSVWAGHKELSQEPLHVWHMRISLAQLGSDGFACLLWPSLELYRTDFSSCSDGGGHVHISLQHSTRDKQQNGRLLPPSGALALSCAVSSVPQPTRADEICLPASCSRHLWGRRPPVHVKRHVMAQQTAPLLCFYLSACIVCTRLLCIPDSIGRTLGAMHRNAGHAQAVC